MLLLTFPRYIVEWNCTDRTLTLQVFLFHIQSLIAQANTIPVTWTWLCYQKTKFQPPICKNGFHNNFSLKGTWTSYQCQYFSTVCTNSVLTLLNSTVPVSKVRFLYMYDYCHCARIDTVYELDLYHLKKKKSGIIARNNSRFRAWRLIFCLIVIWL